MHRAAQSREVAHEVRFHPDTEKERCVYVINTIPASNATLSWRRWYDTDKLLFVARNPYNGRTRDHRRIVGTAY